MTACRRGRRAQTALALRRKSWLRVHRQVVVNVTQRISDRDARRLSVRRLAVKGGRPVGAGNHAVNDEEDALDQSGVCRRNQIRRVDAGRKIAPAGFSWVTRRQGAARGNAGKAGLTPVLNQEPDQGGQHRREAGQNERGPF